MAPTPAAHASAPLLERVSPNLSAELRRYLVRHRAEVEAMIKTGSEDAGLRAGKRQAKVFDGLLGSLMTAVEAAMTRAGDWVPTTLAAVGSYGRGAVAFHSDLD